jgi:hypothetical protein
MWLGAIATFVVEEIKARTSWFYDTLERLAPVTRWGKGTERCARTEEDAEQDRGGVPGALRQPLLLANELTGGHTTPDNTDLLIVTPLRFHCRRLHYSSRSLAVSATPGGGTRSHSVERGRVVRHRRPGLTYVGGTLGPSLHLVMTRRRLTQTVKPSDRRFPCFNSWRLRAPALRYCSVR